MREVTTKQQNRMFIFESAADIERYSDPTQFKEEYRTTERRRAKFVGRDDINSWDDLKKVQTDAWQHGLEVLGMFVEKLKEAPIPELKNKQRQTKFNMDEGDEIDLDKLREGLPFYRKSEREDKPGPVEVTVIIDTTTQWTHFSDDILWRGAAAIALAQILEAKGYRVEIWVCNGSKLFMGETTNVMTACCLKKTSDPMDISTLVNTVSGWFYRTATFTLLETICRKNNKETEWGLGHIYSPRPGDLDEVSRDQNRIYSSGVFSFSGALSMITAELNKLVEQEVK